MTISLVLFGFVAIVLLIVILSSIKVISQAETAIVERLGRYHKLLTPGLNIVVPFVDRVAYRHDMREQVATFAPQPVITQDNLVVSIDSVIYFQITDPRDASYEISNYLWGMEQLTITTLRNVIGGMDLETTLTSRDQINGQLRGVLDEATGKWGIRVVRVELKSIDPPPSVQESMEKQMRAEREKRAAILTAEGSKQSAVLQAEGSKQAAVLQAEGAQQALVLQSKGQAEATVLRAEAEAEAIKQIFAALSEADLSADTLAYQYLQQLPVIANGNSNSVFILPPGLDQMVQAITGGVGKHTAG